MSRQASRRTRERGTTILEMLMYVAILGMLINLVVSLFSSSTRLTALNGLALERLEGVTAIQRAFSEAVMPAAGFAESAGAYRSGGDTLVLRLPGEDGCRRYRVLGAIHDANHFTRLDLTERGGVLDSDYLATLPIPIEGLEFRVKGGAVTLEFAIQKDPEERKTEPVIHRAVASPRAIAGGIQP